MNECPSLLQPVTTHRLLHNEMDIGFNSVCVFVYCLITLPQRNAQKQALALKKEGQGGSVHS